MSSLQPTQPFSPTLWYRIRNTITNPTTHCLDVINDSDGDPNQATGHLKISTIGHYSGQYWNLAPNPASTNTNLSSGSTSNSAVATYILRTWWLGPSRYLTVTADENTLKPILLPGDRQIWRVGKWGDGTFYFSTTVEGKEKVLEGAKDGRNVVLREKDGQISSQRWMLDVIRGINEEGYHDHISVREGEGEVFVMSDNWTRS